MAFTSLRKALVYTFTVPAGPERVFPLLCPVREYDWIPHWKCELVYAESGAAERDCVFRTEFPGHGLETWTCYLHEPNGRIGYLRMSGERVARLEISLRPVEGGTELVWKSVLTGLGSEGSAYIEKMTGDAYEKDVAGLAALLGSHLEAGEPVAAGNARA